MFANQLHKVPSASYVIEHEVVKKKEDVFRKWQLDISKTASRYEGYLGTDVYPPQETQKKWYIIMHFDDPHHLADWLRSPERLDLVEQGHKTFENYQITYYRTGLERWFLKENASAPAWKQNLSVLLGLYPTVMGLLFLQASLPWMSTLSQADAMLISNFMSCALLGWVVMPFVTKLFKFWLLPAGQASTANTVMGALLIFCALILMRSLFVL